MNKIIANILILCIMICSFATVSFASENAQMEYAVAGIFDGASAGASVSLFVLKDGVTMESLQTAEGSIMDKVCHVDAGNVTSGGIFRIMVTIDEAYLDNTCVLTCGGVRKTGTLRSFVPSLITHYIYVSPNKAGGSGSIDNPYGSIADAMNAAKSYSTLGHNVEILLNGGEYRITEPVTLSDANVNNSDAYIRVAPASNSDKVVINGMKQIPSDSLRAVTDSDILERLPENARGKVYSADLLSAGFTLSDISFMYSYDGSASGTGVKRSALPPSLYLNGKRQSMSQYPNEGWLTTTNVGKKADGRPYLVAPTNETSGWENAYIMGFLLESFRVKYAKAEEVSGSTVTLDGDDTLWTDSSGTKTYGPRFVVCNIIEEMDVPGEWCIDEESGTLYYFAPHTITEDDVLEIPYANSLVNISGTSSVTIQNLELKGARKGTVVTATRANGFNLLNCNVHASARAGVAVSYCQNALVDSCNVYDTGGRAISVYGGADAQTLETSDNIVSNNHIYDYSNNPSLGSNNMAIGLGRGDDIVSMGDVAEHNLIHGGRYSGGFIYGGMDNKVQYNEIYNVITDTQDAGAIYAGRRFTEYGNLVAYNFIHDFGFKYDQRYSNRAIYWDDYQSGQTAKGNIIVSDSSENTAGILSIGADNVIRGNILVNVNQGISLSDRSTWDINFTADSAPYTSFNDLPSESSKYYSKIMALKNKIDANPKAMVYDALAENNVLVNSSMKVSAGLYEGKNVNNVSLTGDVFTDAQDRDYTIKSSVASANGITDDVPLESNFNMDSIGIIKDVPFTDHEFKLMYPLNGSKVCDESMFITWQPAVFADRYDYVIARDSDLNDVVLTGSTRETFVQAPNLANGTYYWRVTAVNTSRNMGSSWTNKNGICSFTVTDGMSLEIIDISLPSSSQLKDFDAKYAIYNKTNTKAYFTVVAALFNKEDNSLIAAHTSEESSCEGGSCATGSIPFSLDSTVNADEVYIRIFVLDNLENLSPKSYSKNK